MECQSHRFTYDEPLRVETILKPRVAHRQDLHREELFGARDDARVRLDRRDDLDLLDELGEIGRAHV